MTAAAEHETADAAPRPGGDPITGLAPHGVRESTVMIVWPSIASTWLGRLLGAAFDAAPRWGFLDAFTVKNFVILAAAPLGAALFAWTHAPFVCRRFHLTNRRLRVERGYAGRIEAEIALDAFDEIQIEKLPGHEWFSAGDLIFFRAGQPVLRLEGLGRPSGFRQTCIKTRAVFVALRNPRVKQG